MKLRPSFILIIKYEMGLAVSGVYRGGYKDGERSQRCCLIGGSGVGKALISCSEMKRGKRVEET